MQIARITPFQASKDKRKHPAYANDALLHLNKVEREEKTEQCCSGVENQRQRYAFDDKKKERNKCIAVCSSFQFERFLPFSCAQQMTECNKTNGYNFDWHFYTLISYNRNILYL